MAGIKWTRMGDLLSKRRAHRSIVIGDFILHIGGTDTQYVVQTSIQNYIIVEIFQTFRTMDTKWNPIPQRKTRGNFTQLR